MSEPTKFRFNKYTMKIHILAIDNYPGQPAAVYSGGKWEGARARAAGY